MTHAKETLHNVSPNAVEVSEPALDTVVRTVDSTIEPTVDRVVPVVERAISSTPVVGSATEAARPALDSAATFVEHVSSRSTGLATDPPGISFVPTGDGPAEIVQGSGPQPSPGVVSSPTPGVEAATATRPAAHAAPGLNHHPAPSTLALLTPYLLYPAGADAASPTASAASGGTHLTTSLLPTEGAASATGWASAASAIALLLLLAFAAPTLLRAFKEAPAFLRPAPFITLLERPG